MGRPADGLRRHLPTLAVLAAVTLAVHLSALLRWSPAEPQPIGGVYPVLSLLAAIADALPDAGPFTGRRLVGLAFAFAMGAGLLIQVWRLTANRVVALSAAVLVAAHPLAVRAVQHPQGLRDLVGVAFLVALVARHARPRPRPSRFPDRLPSAFSPPTLALLLVGVLAAPYVWLAPLLLLIQDASFERLESLRRQLRGYAAYGAVGVGALILSLVGDGGQRLTESFADAPYGAGPGARLVALIAPRAAATPSGFLIVLLSLALCAGLGAFALDVLFGVGRRRTLFRYFGFAAAWLLVALVLISFLPRLTPTGNALAAAVAPAILLPALLWRLAVRVHPPAAVSPVGPTGPPPLPPSWDVLVGGLGLRPLPDLPSFAARVVEAPVEPAPAPAVATPEPPAVSEPRDGVLADLLARIRSDREGRPARSVDERFRRFDRALFERYVASRVPAAGHVLELASPGSPYSTTLAARAQRTTVVAPDSASARTGFPELAGVPDVEIVVRDEDGGWRIADGVVNFAFGDGDLDVFDSGAGELFAELARTLVPGGSTCLVGRPPRGDAGLDLDRACAFAEKAALEVLEVDGSSEDGTWVLVLRKPER